MFPAKIDEQPDVYLNSIGEVFAEFGANTQDSGNISYGVTVDGYRYFVKTAGRPDDPKPFSPAEQRQEGVRRAGQLAAEIEHDTLPAYHGLIETPWGPALVFDWREGDHLGTHLDRFRALSADEITEALDQLYDLHDVLSSAGWVEGDFYDGSLLYDFDTHQLTVMDLDDYRPGAYSNDMGRMFGSTRFMAPEELTLGDVIDDRTTTFVMARTALVLLSDGTLDRPAFRGTDAQYAILEEATTTRYDSYQAFYSAWLEVS
ncbi:serine/threonine protein kinase [Kribbella antibiotica]|uniref:Serine/threonine protein kinase n=1 Tax=Kribbella antibiotica TaxID=190195 RepID=A0A4R4YWV8_9ACTN|nr:serine/threonine protein kinase [Kribbella antibiotica]TDD49856.1 serine/threonine protein kinase [Kribbella antibiotica]